MDRSFGGMINVVCNVRNGILVVRTYARRGSFGSLEDDLRQATGPSPGRCSLLQETDDSSQTPILALSSPA
jgi:hypothetical protein